MWRVVQIKLNKIDVNAVSSLLGLIRCKAVSTDSGLPWSEKDPEFKENESSHKLLVGKMCPEVVDTFIKI